MTIRTKLLLIFSLFALMLVGISSLQYRQIQQTTESFRRLDNETSPTLTSLLEISAAARRASIKTLEYALRNLPQDRDKAEESVRQLQRQVERFLELSRDNTNAETHRQLVRLTENLATAVKQGLDSRSRLDPAERFALSLEQNPDSSGTPDTLMLHEVTRLNTARSRLIHFINPLIREQYRLQEQLSSGTAGALNAANRLQLFSMLALALIALLLGAILWRSLALPLTRLAYDIRAYRLGRPVRVSAGRRPDEIGTLARSFRSMTRSLEQQHLKVQENEERFSKVFYNLPLALAILDFENNIRLDLNDTYARQLGYTRDELLGRSVFEDVSWIDQEAQQQTIHTMLERGSVYNLPTAIQVRSGEVRHFLFSGSMLEIGQRKMAMVTLVDMTDRVQLERELREQQQQLERLVEERTASLRDKARIIDQTHDSIVTTDLDGKILSWNRGAERLFGIGEEQALGQPVSLVYPPRTSEELTDQVIGPLLEKGAHELEVTLKRHNGETFPAHLSLSILCNDDGTPKALLGYTIDLTEVKQRERELEELTRRLQDSNRELEAFSYSVSHDLRTPLRAIDGFSLALLEDYEEQLDEEGRSHLKRVRLAAQRMGRLIDELLQLSRVTRTDIRPSRLAIRPLAESIFEELQQAEPERQVDWSIEDDAEVVADPGLLRVLLENLIGNAWKFTGQREQARIRIRSTGDSPTVICIEDNGAGFDMRHASKLFGAFQRLHRTDEFSGSGIGLATVQRIVQRHGGRIWAEAEPDRGSRFYFHLGQEPEDHRTGSSRVSGV